MHLEGLVLGEEMAGVITIHAIIHQIGKETTGTTRPACVSKAPESLVHEEFPRNSSNPPPTITAASQCDPTSTHCDGPAHQHRPCDWPISTLDHKTQRPILDSIGARQLGNNTDENPEDNNR